jgi:uncharacterized protein YjbI with pentapeptide repeats
MEMAQTRRVSRLASWLETHPSVKILTITSALFAFVFNLAYEFIRIRPLQEEERQARFWEIIARPAPGNSGKTQALEYLNRQRVPLHGINLSCERNAGEWKPVKVEHHRFDVQVCVGGVYLRNANLPGANLATGNLRGVSLDDARLKNANLTGANLRGASLAGADLRGSSLVGATGNASDFSAVSFQGANLENANLFGSALVAANLSAASAPSINLGNASLIGADLRGADLSGARLGYASLQAANLAKANFNGADLSKANLALAGLNGATFRDVKGLTSEQLAGAWAWSDTPPKNLPEGIEIARLCDPGEDGARRSTYQDLLAKGRATFANLDHCGPGKNLSADEVPAELRNIPKAATPPVAEKLEIPLLQYFQR